MAHAHQVVDIQSLVRCECDRLDVMHLGGWCGLAIGHAVFAQWIYGAFVNGELTPIVAIATLLGGLCVLWLTALAPLIDYRATSA